MLTTPRISRASGESESKVRRALKMYGPEPVDVIGNAHIWDESQWPQIKESLRKVRAPGRPVSAGAGK